LKKSQEYNNAIKLADKILEKHPDHTRKISIDIGAFCNITI